MAFKFVAGGVVALMVLSLGMCSMETVDTGHRGVFVKFGEPVEQVDEGLHFLNPLTTKLVEMDVRQQKRTDTTNTYTKDVQKAAIKYSITYSLDPKAALRTYQEVGVDWDTQDVPQIVEKSIKDVFGQSEAVKDAINQRAEVQSRISEELRKGLAAKNIVLRGFEIRNIDFSNAFENAVEAKQVAVENANAAKNRTVEIEERAKQKVIAAQADAEAMKIKTQALAGNAKLVEYEAVQKWNGELCPEGSTCIYGDSGAVPFVNVK